MGSSASKTAHIAPKIRAFPSTPSPATRIALQQQPVTPAQRHTPARPSESRTDAINTDAHDPAFAARLQKIGIVQPNPFIPLSQQPHATTHNSQPTDTTVSGPSRGEYTAPLSAAATASSLAALDQNPALLVLRAREALQRQYEEESERVGQKGFKGRSFLDVGSLREAVRLRSAGMGEAEIEKKFGLMGGAMGRVGARGVVDVVSLNG